MIVFFLIEYKTLWEKEKMLVTRIFSIFHNVFKRHLHQGRQKSQWCGKGLNLTLKYDLDLHTYLTNTSSTSIQYRVSHSQQFFEQVTKPHCVYSGYQHLKEWYFLVVFEGRDYFLPQIHPLGLKVYITTPQVSASRHLKYEYSCIQFQLYAFVCMLLNSFPNNRFQTLPN